MREIEAVYDRPIETILRTFYYDEQLGYDEMAVILNVPAKTLHGWMVRLGINPQQLAQQKAREMAS